jgi:hypothetical protein
MHTDNGILTPMDIERCSVDVLPGDGEEPSIVVHLDLTTSIPTIRKLTGYQDVNTGSRWRDLRIRVESLNDILGPAVEVTTLRIPTGIEIDSNDLGLGREHETDAVCLGSPFTVIGESGVEIAPVRWLVRAGVRTPARVVGFRRDLGWLPIALFLTPADPLLDIANRIRNVTIGNGVQCHGKIPGLRWVRDRTVSGRYKRFGGGTTYLEWEWGVAGTQTVRRDRDEADR